MSWNEMDAQFASLVADGQFSEEIEIFLDEYSSIVARGVFFSGSYDDGSQAQYAPKRMVGRDYLQVSAMELGDIRSPWETLRGCIVHARGTSFRVYDVSGRRSPVLTLELQEMREEEIV